MLEKSCHKLLKEMRCILGFPPFFFLVWFNFLQLYKTITPPIIYFEIWSFQLENAVADEMATFKEEWETVLDELETESAHLLVWITLYLSNEFVDFIFMN